MNWIAGAGLLVAVALAGVAAGVRMIDVPAARYHETGGPEAPGDHPDEGGFTAVRDLADPSGALASLAAVAGAAPRTTPLAGSVGEGHVSYVTRTRVFGFPDVTNLWIDGGRLHVRGHLVIGRGDMGVNRTRVERWLAQAGIA